MDGPGVAEKFFQDLAQAGPQPLLARVSGSIRIDVIDGDTCERFHFGYPDLRVGVAGIAP